MKEQITPRQAGIFCFLTMIASKILLFPSVVYQESGFSAFYVIIISFLIEIGFLFVFIKLKEKYVDKSFFEILSGYFGKFIAKIIYFLFFTYFLLKILFAIEENFVYLKEFIFEEANIFRFYFVVLPVVSALVFRGLTALGRTAEFYYIFIVFGFIVCLALGVSSVPEINAPIYSDINFLNIFSNVYRHIFWFGDFFFFLIILDKVKAENGFGKQIFKFVIFSLVLMAIFLATYYTIYSTTAFMHRSAISDVTQFVSKIGSLEKLNLIAILTITFSMIFQLAIFMYSMENCMENIYRKTNKAQNLIFINIIIIALSINVFYNSDITVNFFTSYGIYLALILAIVLPIFLTFVAFGKKRRFKELKK